MSNIEKVVMIDHGNGGKGGGGLNRFAQTAPTMIFALLQQLQALGLNLPDLMKQLGTTDAAKIPDVIAEEIKKVRKNGEEEVLDLKD